MRIEFKLDRKKAFAAGINTTSDKATLDIDPAQLPDDIRAALAVRLSDNGIVRQMTSEGNFYSDPITAVAPTLESLLVAIAGEEQAYARNQAIKAENEADKKKRVYDDTLAVLTSRKTKTVTTCLFACRAADNKGYMSSNDETVGDVKFTEYQPSKTASGIGRIEYKIADWPYVTDATVKALPEAVEWEACLLVAKQESIANARTEAVKLLEMNERNIEAKRLADIQDAADAKAWIATDGSPRLQRCLAEGIEFTAIYRSERLAKDRPGFRWSEKVRGEYTDPRNPSTDAFKLLDDARKLDQDAELKYWTVDATTDEYGEDDEPKFRGYVAIAEFLGDEIVMGGPE